jgi:hypothetical protein
MEHVVNIIGGAESQEKYGDQPGPRFTPVSRARQIAAIRFIEENAFQTPEFFIDNKILSRIEPEGSLRRIGGAQNRILTDVLDSDRLNRMAEYQAVAKKNASQIYSPSEFLTEVRRSIWSELASSHVTIDPFRRSLQRAFLAQADAKLNSSAASVIVISGGGPRRGSGPNSDVRALMRGELVDLDGELRAALDRASDRTTRLHILDSRAEIKRILNPKD